jgi:hypothetical protein
MQAYNNCTIHPRGERIQMAENFGIITNCTARKRAVGQAVGIGAGQLHGGPQRMAAQWLRTMSRTSATLSAADLYVGRAMSLSRAVASSVGGSLHIISAGLGLAAGEDRVPNYDLTVSSGAGSLGPALAQGGYDASDWWHSLNELKGTPLPLSRLINSESRTRFLLALPSTYVDLVQDDLARLKDDALERLSVFTSRAGVKALPHRLQRRALPYDERLEGSQAHAGTRTDFPQRAMRHFVDEIGGHRLEVRGARQAVALAMDRLSRPTIPERTRKSDHEIINLINANWNVCSGHSSRLLKHLRNNSLVQCEQSRFSALWRQVKAEHS